MINRTCKHHNGKACELPNIQCAYPHCEPVSNLITDNSAVIAKLEARCKELESALQTMAPIYHQLAWIAICWNDHNFDAKSVYDKVSTAFGEAGFTRSAGVNPVNDFVDKLEALLSTPTTDEHLQKLFVEWLGEPVAYSHFNNETGRLAKYDGGPLTSYKASDYYNFPLYAPKKVSE